jgi:hypothetical protein
MMLNLSNLNKKIIMVIKLFQLHQALSLPTLSHLKTHTNTHTVILSYNKNNDKQKNKHIKNVLNDTDNKLHDPSNIDNKDINAKETEPVFIKVEEEENINFTHELDVEDCFYFDDESGTEDVNDPDLKVIEYIHTYHSRFIPGEVAEVSQIFL